MFAESLSSNSKGGGYLLSQDGHLPPVLNLFNDKNFWKTNFNIKKPEIEGFGISKLIKIRK